MSNAIERSKEFETTGGVNTTAQATQEQENKEHPVREKYSFSISPMAFPTTLEGQLTTSVLLEELINSTMRPVFRDYVGCRIVYTTINLQTPNAVGPNGFVAYNQAAMQMGTTKIPRFEVEMYFRVGANSGRCAEGAINNIRPFAAVNKGVKNMAARIAAINKSSIVGKNLTLTDETKEMLDEFYLAPYRKNIQVVEEVADDKGNVRKIKKTVAVPRWDEGLIFEVTDGGNIMGNFNTIYLKVTNMDLISIIRKIYGSKNEFGHQVDYEVRAIKPIALSPNPAENNLLLMINRLDCSSVSDLSRKLGYMTTINGLQINCG